MRFYLKIFGIAFLCFAVIIGAGLYFFIHNIDKSVVVKSEGTIQPRFTEDKISDEDRLDLSVMTRKSARVNVLLLGSDGGRSDMMMVISYDPIRKLADLISVPRDTYNRVAGYDSPGMHKINAVYGLKNGEGGPDGTRRQIEKVLQIPIHYYVNVDYNAVREIVDIMGGVQVEVPRRMKYDDPYSKPPLHIDLQPGLQTLNGDKAIQFLRWRKNNDGYGEGDIQRIERQHAFVKNAIGKAIGLKLPAIIKASTKYVKTDMETSEMIHYAGTSIGMDRDKLQSYRIPGTTATMEGLSYFVHNSKDTGKMMLAIYNRMGTETPVEGTVTHLKQLDPTAVESETALPMTADKPSKKKDSDAKAKKEKEEAPVSEDPQPEAIDAPVSDPSATPETPLVTPPATDGGTTPADGSTPAVTPEAPPVTPDQPIQ